MTQTILNGVSKRMRIDFINGNLSEIALTKQYERNLQEAINFSFFGYAMSDLIDAERNTHNPLLKSRLRQAIQDFRNKKNKSGEQNKLSVEKLQQFKQSALGIGLRQVILKMRQYCRQTKNEEARLTLMLLELEFANLSAKMGGYSNDERRKIYERKDILLYNIQPLLQSCEWRYGYNDASGKNANYIIYVYLPNGVQISWHSNDYYLYKYYPPLNVEWDGQVCMTMQKILNYINEKFLNIL